MTLIPDIVFISIILIAIAVNAWVYRSFDKAIRYSAIVGWLNTNAMLYKHLPERDPLLIYCVVIQLAMLSVMLCKLFRKEF